VARTLGIALSILYYSESDYFFRKMKNLFLLLALAALSFGCSQNTTGDNPRHEDPAAYTNEVNEAVELFRQALVDPDASVLEKLTAETLTYGHSNGLIEDRKTCIESMISGKFNFESVELSEQTVDVSGNTAIVRHILFGKTHDAGKEPGTAHLKVLQVWQKQNGNWVLLARQAVKILQPATL